jgi:hypothetical protein
VLLKGLLEVLDPDCKRGVEFMKPPDDFELIQMMVVPIMDFAHENDPLGRELLRKAFRRKRSVQSDGIEGSLLLGGCPRSPESVPEQQDKQAPKIP